MARQIYILGYTLRGFALRAGPLVLPGLLLLLGGLSPPLQNPAPATNTGDVLANALYPDNWPMLIVCSLLICLPGVIFVLAADYLADIVFWRVNVNTTPAVIWTALGYIISLAAAAMALVRLLNP